MCSVSASRWLKLLHGRCRCWTRPVVGSRSAFVPRFSLSEPLLPDGFSIYTDGSGKSSDDGIVTAGWGFVVICPDSTELRFCGPVVLDSSHPLYCRATALTNNTAELSALYFAALWCAQHLPTHAHVRFYYDSTYAANVSRQRWSPTSHFVLVKALVRLVDSISRSFAVSWTWVKGHSGSHFNNIADSLANSGADGHTAIWVHYDISHLHALTFSRVGSLRWFQWSGVTISTPGAHGGS